MKKILSLCSALLLLCQVSLFAQDDNDNKNDNKEKKKYEFVKNKSFSKSYSLSSDKVSIQNSFGSVEIKTWSKNEVKVDVAIEVSSNVETLAQKIIDGISINSGNSNGVWFKTENKGTNNNNGEKSTMSIDYVVYLPASNPLKVSNEFGKTIIPDYSGEVDLTSKFGSLTTGTLSNNKSISVEFGKANLGSVTNGNVSVKYSKAEIAKVAGNLKMNFEFCSATKINFDNSATSLDVKASYSTVNLRPMGDPSASYDISTSFGSFKNRTSVKFDGDDDGEDHGPKFDFHYSGKSGSGNIPVKVKTSFGKVILGEPTADDIKEKNKNKSKPKST
jgi:hypothetical protein